MLRPDEVKALAGAAKAEAKRAKEKARERKNKQKQMDASYEVLGSSDRDSEESVSEEEVDDEDVNGEEVREQMEGFRQGQIIRTVIAGIGFAMSVIGIWGDGSADLVIIEM